MATDGVRIFEDDDADEAISERWARFCREAGALSDLPVALNTRALILLFACDLPSAASLVEEVRAATDATGIDIYPVGAVCLAAFQGHEAEASPYIEANVSEALRRREGVRLAVATWASAVLNNGLGRYQDALAAAQVASESARKEWYPRWVLAELIEAAVRTGDASGSHRRLPPARRDGRSHRQRLGTGPAGTVARAADRERGGRGVLPGVD